MPLHHRKKRNAGLVYEFLVRRMASTMVDQDPEAYLKALGIAKKYYADGQPLATEKSLFDVVVSSRGLSEQAASRILQEVQRHARNTNARLLEIKKSNLIKDVNYTFGPDFFNVHRIREYRLLASIQMLIDRYRNAVNAPLSEDVERIRLEESLIGYMITRDARPVHIKSEEVDPVVATLAMRKFEDRYSGVLSESQRTTLRRFMDYSMSGDTDSFRKDMESERSIILRRLSEARNEGEFVNDEVMLKRLDESMSQLRGTDDVTTESAIQDILLYQRLLSEIDSNAD